MGKNLFKVEHWYSSTRTIVKTQHVIVGLEKSHNAKGWELIIKSRKNFADLEKRVKFSLENLPINQLRVTLVARRAQMLLSLEEINELIENLRKLKKEKSFHIEFGELYT